MEHAIELPDDAAALLLLRLNTPREAAFLELLRESRQNQTGHRVDQSRPPRARITAIKGGSHRNK
jgi:hypothetical protein